MCKCKSNSEANESDDEDVERSILEEVLHASKKQKLDGKYIDLRFIIPTSNCIERLFSMAKYVYTPHRQKMFPTNLEAVLFLRVNNALWPIRDVASTV